jgi:hypothetical protein
MKSWKAGSCPNSSYETLVKKMRIVIHMTINSVSLNTILIITLNSGPSNFIILSFRNNLSQVLEASRAIYRSKIDVLVTV